MSKWGWHCRTEREADVRGQVTGEAAATQITSVCSSAITCHIHSLLKDHRSLQVLRCQRKSTFWGNVICREERLTLIKIALRHYDSSGTHSVKGSWSPGRESKAIWDPQKPGRPGALRGQWEGFGLYRNSLRLDKNFRAFMELCGGGKLSSDSQGHDKKKKRLRTIKLVYYFPRYGFHSQKLSFIAQEIHKSYKKI